jgi:hypothetical protein
MPSFFALRITGASHRARAGRIARRRRGKSSGLSAICAAISSTVARSCTHDADLDHQRQLWLDRVANVRLRGTTHERPRVRFDREERFLLQPLAPRRYTSLVLERPSATAAAHRPPRPVITVEKRSLAAYAQLTGGAA